MEIWLTILAVALAYIVAVVTPGPNFLITVKNSLTHSRHIGVYTALGIAGGTSVHVAAGFIGLTAIFWQISWLFEVVKILGAAYLIYMGYKVLATKTHPVEFQYQKDASDFGRTKAVRLGFYTCVSNPKSALFYLSLFTAIIPPTSPDWAQMFMAVMMVVLSVGWYAGVAFLFSEPLVQQGYRKVERGVNYLVGGLFIGLGLRLIMVRK